jgi:uncharacterized protein
MRLDLDRSPAGRSELPISGTCALALDGDELEQVELDGQLQLDNLEGRCVLIGELEATGEAACNRCLARFRLTFPVPVELVVMRDASEETDDADTLVLYQRSGVIDLSEPLREAAVLAIPQTRLCRPDCRGLCARCGADLNDGDCSCEDDDIDPRWDGLPD